jgi:hypothetical protein
VILCHTDKPNGSADPPHDTKCTRQLQFSNKWLNSGPHGLSISKETPFADISLTHTPCGTKALQTLSLTRRLCGANVLTKHEMGKHTLRTQANGILRAPWGLHLLWGFGDICTFQNIFSHLAICGCRFGSREVSTGD